MAQSKKGRDLANWRPTSGKGSTSTNLRIVGGRFRGRQIAYSGDQRTRPMRDSVREALFNLVGGWVPGKAVFDLFAGTGAVGIEALSRGASRVFLNERHFPTARIIRDNLKSLEEELPAEVSTSDTFFWCRQFFKDPSQWPTEPWMVFCCPPYALFHSRTDDLMSMLQEFIEHAPEGSVIVAETDTEFDLEQLPRSGEWRMREYAPAQICVWRPNAYDTVQPGTDETANEDL
ncbi:MAG: RsmD family RNA methyltransferase [Pirellulaceae bacterium]